jgi:hypothetical protein
MALSRIMQPHIALPS